MRIDFQDGAQESHHILRKNGVCQQNAQAFTGELVQDAQSLELLSICQPVKQDVVRPDVVWILGLLWLGYRMVVFIVCIRGLKPPPLGGSFQHHNSVK